jgi:3,2-trans-enoyl-CoA isomerase
MSSVLVSTDGGIATVTLNRGKVNALNESTVEEIRNSFETLENNQDVRAIIFTGHGKFFSFGFDIPEFLSYSKNEFIRYLEKFTSLCTYLFLYPKPIIAALNGHAIAGGCMLATTCDYRLMVSDNAKISLNEINFGSSVFASSVDILRFCVGSINAQRVLYSGAMFSAEEAKRLALIDKIISQDELMEKTQDVAEDFARKDSAAFRSMKQLLRKPVADEIAQREKASIREFVDIWYSEKTWKNLQEIKIHS